MLHFPKSIPHEEDDEILVESEPQQVREPNTQSNIPQEPDQQLPPELPPIPAEISPAEIDLCVEPDVSHSSIESVATPPIDNIILPSTPTCSDSTITYSHPKRDRKPPIHLRDGTYVLY